MTRPWRSIVVDDNVPFLKCAARLLSSIEDVLVVGEATSGEAAVEAVARLKPDFVLMDLSMPGIGGISATRRIATEERPPAIVIVTLLDLPEYRDVALAAGACAFLGKALLPETLPAVIRSLRSNGDPGSAWERPNAWVHRPQRPVPCRTTTDHNPSSNS